MKKTIIAISAALFFAACGSGESTSTSTTDSTATDSVAVDSVKVSADSTK